MVDDTACDGVGDGEGEDDDTDDGSSNCTGDNVDGDTLILPLSPLVSSPNILR